MDSITIFCAKYLLVVSVVLILFIWARLSKDKKIAFIIYLAMAGLFAYLIAKIGSALFYDPRPFVSKGISPLIAHSADNGFPSDHAWFTATLAAFLWKYSKNLAYLAGLVAVVVAIARVHANVHSPIDVIAGLIIGVVAVYLSTIVGPWAQSKLTK